ncbi:MAG: tRNA guanosine(34) transglycosylase Tgt [Gemmatimonadetes bacterium]|nr:tRNA guanosine(34) transglycosylase Tgt [Gemmatimonadota bacterium]
MLARDSGTAARAGVLETPHGAVETPAFMPVGTQATVKAVTPGELHEIGVPMLLANAYHLYLRPGTETVMQAGGLHRFMAWDGPILTDSGGYQVFSLAGLVRVDDDGVTFRSHLDGSSHRFTPETVMEVQRALGADVVMPLDHCLPNPAEMQPARAAVDRTLRWLERSVHRLARMPVTPSRGTPPVGDGCMAGRAETVAGSQALFGIVQGGTHPDLRRESARATRAFDLPGTAIGGLAVGEPREVMYEMLEVVEPELDAHRPRYLMGVGFPGDLLQAVARGMDLFDCVAPTRHGRNGTLFTSEGRLNIRGAAHRRDHGPIDPACACRACASTSRAYLSHLFHARELLGLRLASYHNLAFLTGLMREARTAILRREFGGWAASLLDRERTAVS